MFPTICVIFNITSNKEGLATLYVYVTPKKYIDYKLNEQSDLIINGTQITYESETVLKDETLEDNTNTATLVKVLEGEDVEKYDSLLSLAITGGNYEWIQSLIWKDKDMKIAVLGPAGTFCDKACSDYITTDYDGNDQLKPVYYQTIDEVFEKFQCPFVIKILNKLRIEKSF